MTNLELVFLAITIIFLTINLRDYLKTEGKLSIARKIWLRLAFVFTGVAIGFIYPISI